MNVVELENWYCNSIHCPFCGPGVKEDTEECKHFLYLLVEGAFVSTSERFMALLTLPVIDTSEPKWDAKWNWTTKEILSNARDIIPHLVEFRLDAVSDIVYIGFSSLEEENCT